MTQIPIKVLCTHSYQENWRHMHCMETHVQINVQIPCLGLIALDIF